MFTSTTLRRNLNCGEGVSPCQEAVAFVVGKAEVEHLKAEERSYKWNMGGRMEGEKI
jgi:hypothetical protein